MIYIFTAAYCEAEIFIKNFGLKKVMECTCFQHFYQEEAGLRLTITGIGEIAAAAAVSSICTKYKPKTDDFLLNAGICAGIGKREGIFLVNKLVEQATGMTFYPDLLYRHFFQEAGLMTGMRPWTGCKQEINVPGISLFDMEAAAVYQAGANFFGPHQMAFIKMISDCGEVKENMRQHTGQLMADYGHEIIGFVQQLMCIRQDGRHAGYTDSVFGQGKLSFVKKQKKDGISPERKSSDLEENQEKAWIDQVCTDLHCSKSMENSLKQHIRYLYLSGIDYKAVIQNMYAQDMLPCRDKREGKRCFETFRKSLF